MFLLAVLLIVDARANLDLGVRQETRVRSRFADDAAFSAVGADLILEPGAAFSVNAMPWSFGLGYNPRLMLPQFTARLTPQVLHRAFLSATAPASKRGLLKLNQSFSFGTLDFTQLAVDTVGVIEPIPSSTVGSYISSTTEGGIEIEASSLTKVDLKAMNALSGGATVAAQQEFPLRLQTMFMPKLEQKVGRLDKIILASQDGRTAFSNGATYWHAEGTAAWEHRFNRMFAAQAGGGAAVVAPTAGPLAGPPIGYPVALLQLSHRMLEIRERGVDVTMSGSMRPYFDRLTTLVYQRVQVQLMVRAQILRQLAAELTGYYAAGLPTPGQPGITMGLVKGSVEWKMDKRLTLEGGVMAAWQTRVGDLTTGQQWIGFVAIAFQERI